MTTPFIKFQRLLIKSLFEGITFASNPLFAGALLFLLTRQPGQSGDKIKEGLVEQIGRLPFEVNLERTITVLKWLFGYGFVSRANMYLNTIAQNSWTLTAPASDWVWHQEIAVVTGGSAGIGEQTSIRLVRKGVKVAILDISPPTNASLQNSKCTGIVVRGMLICTQTLGFISSRPMSQTSKLLVQQQRKSSRSGAHLQYSSIMLELVLLD